MRLGVYSVACPDEACSASEGTYCRTPKGTRRDTPHAGRMRLWETTTAPEPYHVQEEQFRLARDIASQRRAEHRVLAILQAANAMEAAVLSLQNAEQLYAGRDPQLYSYLRQKREQTEVEARSLSRQAVSEAQKITDAAVKARLAQKIDLTDEIPGLSDPHADPTATPMSAEADVKYRPLKES